MKNSNDTIGNGTRDLPVCSAVPQPTAPARKHECTFVKKSSHNNATRFGLATIVRHVFTKTSTRSKIIPNEAHPMMAARRKHGALSKDVLLQYQVVLVLSSA